LDFREEVKKDEEIRRYLTSEEIDEALSEGKYLRYVDTIFKRVFG
jgi:adenylosuccinate lyase